MLTHLKIVVEIQLQSLHLLEGSFCQPLAQLNLAHVSKSDVSVLKLISCPEDQMSNFHSVIRQGNPC